MRIFVVQEWVAYEGAEVVAVMVDEAAARAVYDADQADAARNEAFCRSRGTTGHVYRHVGSDVTCWEPVDDVYVQVDGWPHV